MVPMAALSVSVPRAREIRALPDWIVALRNSARELADRWSFGGMRGGTGAGILSA